MSNPLNAIPQVEPKSYWQAKMLVSLIQANADTCFIFKGEILDENIKILQKKGYIVSNITSEKGPSATLVIPCLKEDIPVQTIDEFKKGTTLLPDGKVYCETLNKYALAWVVNQGHKPVIRGYPGIMLNGSYSYKVNDGWVVEFKSKVS